jgi:hypothetical protein
MTYSSIIFVVVIKIREMTQLPLYFLKKQIIKNKKVWPNGQKVAIGPFLEFHKKNMGSFWKVETKKI